MKLTTHLLIFSFLFLTALNAQQQQVWEAGARAGGTLVVPAQASGRVGSGINAGVFLKSSPFAKTGFTLMIDYHKVENILVEDLTYSVVSFSERTIRESDFLSLTGFAAARIGVRIDRPVRRFKTGILRASLDGYMDLMTKVRAYQEVLTVTNFTDLPIVVQSSLVASQNGADDGRMVLSGGIGFQYVLNAGPFIECGWQIDLSNRFTVFEDDRAAKLHQFHLGFNYPLAAVFGGRK